MPLSKLKLGPPLVVQHDDVCLGLVGKASTCTWWPLRVQGSGHDPAVDVIFFGDSKTGRLARNKLRPFADLEEIPSRFIPKRCTVLTVRMRTRRVPNPCHRTAALHTKEACPSHRTSQHCTPRRHVCPTAPQHCIPKRHQGGDRVVGDRPVFGRADIA